MNVQTGSHPEAMSVPTSPADAPRGLSRREFCAAATGALAACVFAPRLSADEDAPGIIGHGDFRYRMDTAWGTQDKTRFPVKDCHEMVQVPDGRLFMLTNHTHNNILVYDKKGRVLESWGTQWPGAHGLTLAVEGKEPFLFITDTVKGQVVKTDLKGKVLMTLGTPRETGKYEGKDKVFRPTEVAVAPGGDFFVADGYGEQHVIHYDAKGELKGCFGGRGEKDGLFRQCHGVAWDARDPQRPLLCVTERYRCGFQWFDPKTYAHVRTVRYPDAYTSRPVIRGRNLFTACLSNGQPFASSNGFLLVLDDKDAAVSAPGAAAPAPADAAAGGERWKPFKREDKGFIHPHDICVDDEENLYVPQWNSGQVYPYKLTRVR